MDSVNLELGFAPVTVKQTRGIGLVSSVKTVNRVIMVQIARLNVLVELVTLVLQEAFVVTVLQGMESVHATIPPRKASLLAIGVSPSKSHNMDPNL